MNLHLEAVSRELIFCNEKAKSLGELINIRDRKIKLLEDEVALLKKILAGFQNAPRCDSGQDKYPKYNELSGGKDA